MPIPIEAPPKVSYYGHGHEAAVRALGNGLSRPSEKAAYRRFAAALEHELYAEGGPGQEIRGFMRGVRDALARED